MDLFYKYCKNSSSTGGKRYTFDSIGNSYETLMFKDLVKMCRDFSVPIS